MFNMVELTPPAEDELGEARKPDEAEYDQEEHFDGFV